MAIEANEAMLKNVRLSFPDLFEAVEFKPGDGKPRWNATFLIVPFSENDKAVWAAINHVGNNEYKDKWPKMLESIKGNSNKFCYQDGDLKEYGGYGGMMALATHRPSKLRNGSANSRPAIIDRDKSPLTAADGKPYGGCYVNAKVSFFAGSKDFPGLFASFSVIQFARDGDAFGSGAPRIDDMEDLGVDETADDLAG